MANLDRYASRGKRKIDFTQENPFKDTALGLVSTKSFPAIVGTADMMLKSAEVTMVGYEKVGNGLCTAVVRGNIADVLKHFIQTNALLKDTYTFLMKNLSFHVGQMSLIQKLRPLIFYFVGHHHLLQSLLNFCLIIMFHSYL